MYHKFTEELATTATKLRNLPSANCSAGVPPRPRGADYAPVPAPAGRTRTPTQACVAALPACRSAAAIAWRLPRAVGLRCAAGRLPPPLSPFSSCRAPPAPRLCLPPPAPPQKMG